jgi:hypothetical protein
LRIFKKGRHVPAFFNFVTLTKAGRNEKDKIS